MVAEFAVADDPLQSVISAPVTSSECHPRPTLSEDNVHITLRGRETVVASKHTLLSRAAFFAPLTDDSGPVTYGDAETETICNSLAPGARQMLPRFIELLGDPNPPAWESLFGGDGLFHAFAVAHILGVSEALAAATRQFAVLGADHQLRTALAALDVTKDAGTLETCARHGLDKLSSTKLLHVAAIADATDAAKVLALADDAMPEVDVRNDDGRTPLHLCAVHDSASVAAVLLSSSACVDALCDPPTSGDVGDDEAPGAEEDPKQRNLDTEPKAVCGTRTPLHLAALHDNPEVAQLLLDARANVAACVKTVEGAVTPLHECAASDAVRVARVLAAAGALAALAAHSAPIVEKCAAPADETSLKDEPSCTDAAALTDKQRAETDVAMPIDEDADARVSWSRFMDPLNAKVGQLSSTPLHVAAENDAAGVIGALVEARADIQASDDQGDTPLHCAVLYGCPRALSDLLAHGASPLQENKSGELPIHVLAEFGPGEIGAELNPALAKRHFARSFKTQELLIRHLDEHSQLAAALAHTASGDIGNTPLHTAARFDHQGAENAVRLLLQSRASIEAKNAEGRTPLGLAARRHGLTGRVAELLKKNGAELPPPQVVDPLAGALGGCVRPLVNVFKGTTVEEFAAALGGGTVPLAASSAGDTNSQAVTESESAGPVLPIISQGRS